MYKHTPGQASADELEATSVAREPLLDLLATRVRQWVAGAAPEHTLVTGDRGMGKTHLLHLLSLRTWDDFDDATRPWIALLPEESYIVGSADDLVRVIWAGVGGRPGDDVNPTNVTEILAAMRKLHDEIGLHILVLLDRIDLVFDQMRLASEAQIRRLMTDTPYLCFIATATRVPEAIADHDRPLHHSMRLETLHPLDAPQASAMLRRRAQWAGETALLEQWQEIEPLLGAFLELAGGNPRHLLVLYQCLQSGKIPAAVAVLRSLLDELTPVHKEIVESRAPQQRKLLTLTAFHDRGPSPSELAEESGIPERQVAAILGHLVNDNLLQRVRKPGSNTSAYLFRDPLLRMWLQMRASPEGEHRVFTIVRFFYLWHSGAEADAIGALGSRGELIVNLLASGRFPVSSQSDEALVLAYIERRDPSLLETVNPEVRRMLELYASKFPGGPLN